MVFPRPRPRLPRFIDGRRIRSWRAGPLFEVQVHDEAHGRFVTEIRGDVVLWRRFNKDGVVVQVGASTRSRWKHWVKTGDELGETQRDWRHFFRGR